MLEFLQQQHLEQLAQELQPLLSRWSTHTTGDLWLVSTCGLSVVISNSMVTPNQEHNTAGTHSIILVQGSHRNNWTESVSLACTFPYNFYYAMRLLELKQNELILKTCHIAWPVLTALALLTGHCHWWRKFYETALIQEVTRPHPGSRRDSDSRSCWKKWQLYTFNKEVWGEMAAISRTQYPLVIYIIEKMAWGKTSHTGNIYHSLSPIYTITQQFC